MNQKCSRIQLILGEFHGDRRLIEITVSHPVGTNAKIGDARPILSFGAVWINGKIYLLQSIKFPPPGFIRDAFILHRDFVIPSNDERDFRIPAKVHTFLCCVDRIEDHFQLVGDCDSDNRASGSPAGDTVAKTPSRCPFRKLSNSVRVMRSEYSPRA